MPSISLENGQRLCTFPSCGGLSISSLSSPLSSLSPLSSPRNFPTFFFSYSSETLKKSSRYRFMIHGLWQLPFRTLWPALPPVWPNTLRFCHDYGQTIRLILFSWISSVLSKAHRFSYGEQKPSTNRCTWSWYLRTGGKGTATCVFPKLTPQNTSTNSTSSSQLTSCSSKSHLLSCVFSHWSPQRSERDSRITTKLQSTQ